MTKFPITAAGYSALQDELNQRIAVERPRLIQWMQEAIADDSNLAENSEYHAAQADQLMNEVRIVELEDKLARAEVIDVSKLSGDTIKFGATVTLINEAATGWETRMTQFQTPPANSQFIERPTCTNCGSVMWTPRITSVGPDVDKRTWECPVCDISERAVMNFN
jgi:hypothetical protein